MAVRSICVFCGSQKGCRPIYEQAAADLGQALADAGITLIYGGGRIGLMGVVADAVKAGGGRVVGVIPEFLQRREVGNPNVDEMVLTGSMHERKKAMFDRSDAFVVLPGGLGTLDETIEMLTWKQLHQHTKPVVLLDIDGYWRPLLSLIDAVIRGGFASEWSRTLFDVVEQVENVLPTLTSADVPSRGSSTGL